MTLAELSASKRRLLERILAGERALPARHEHVVPRLKTASIPLSTEQWQVWLHASMVPEIPLYNEPITIHRRGSFDHAALEASFNEILRRHEIWRTSFADQDGEIVLVVHAALSLRLPLSDLSVLPCEEREPEALRLATQDALIPFDLGCVPLLRGRVCRFAPDDHRLYLTLHHMIFDGVSLCRVLMPELTELYAAFSGGRAPALAQPTLQFGDYALWRLRQARNSDVSQQLAYWHRTLGQDKPPVLRVPTDRNAPQSPARRGAFEKFALSATLSDALKARSRKEGVTLYAMLLAAFKTLLHRYAGQDDIVIGIVVDSRRRPELEGVMGYFLATLPLRTQPGAGRTFRDYLRHVQDEVMSALDASDVSLDRIMREVRPSGDGSWRPLFNVLFSIQPPAGDFAEGWDLTQMDVSLGVTKFDLYLEMEERRDGLIGRLFYASKLFDAQTIRRMINCWITLLDAVVADPDRALGRLPLLSEQERQAARGIWKDTWQSFAPSTVPQRFEAQARVTPAAIAVTTDEASWSYQELDRRASRLAARLRAEGAGREILVAVVLERSLDLVTGLLAILKTGAAYLPLDPALPEERLALILDDAKPQLVLTCAAKAAELPNRALRLILLDEDAPFDVRPFLGASAPRPEDLAYVIYTSGSTGKPKGVEVEHAALLNLLSAMQREPGFGAGDTLLATTTIAFDIAALELFLPLVTGGRVFLAEPDAPSDPMRLIELIERSQCSVMQATPSLWRALVGAGWAGRPGLKILCGGEALSRDLADALLSRSGQLWNMYGPTETTIWSLAHKVEAGGDKVPIGHPVANTRVYILDDCGDALPIGASGELYIGGNGLARRYRNRPDLTQERFVTLPVAPGERLYRTGDRARHRGDGAVEWLGRVDNQVKIRGMRVEPEEVEVLLASHADVAASAVRAWPDPSGMVRLAAYLVFRRTPPPAAAELREFLRRLLPDAMVPQWFVPMPALPSSPNGKIDRNALAPPSVESPSSARVEPSSERERRLARLWQDILGVANVGVQDNFFDLGGHSLALAELLRRIKGEFGRRLSMAAVLPTTTIERMASLLREGQPAGMSRVPALPATRSRPPLFWLRVEPRLRSLVKMLPPDQPFAGIDAEPPDRRAFAPPSNLSQIAAHAVRSIRGIDPSGPYFLGGWCTAGILAYEVASQLMGEGQQVALLVLVDAMNPAHFRGIGAVALELSRLKLRLWQLRRQRGGRRWSHAAERAGGAIRRFVRWTSRPAIRRNPVDFDDALSDAARRYDPPPYAGDVLLLQPVERPALLDCRPGWAETVTGALVAHEIPGDHHTMFENANAEALSAVLNASLRRAQDGLPAAARAGGKVARSPRRS